MVDEYNITLLVAADHGNADEMLEKNKEGNFGLANVAPTIAAIFGLEAPDCWEEAMI